MATLTAATRRGLPLSTFGLPSQRAYPMPDRNHAVLAKAFAKRALESGHISQSAYDEIVAHANRVLGA